jgi:hypothetical protein
MVLERNMICVEKSDYMRNGEFMNKRLKEKKDDVNIVCN